jgi:hypothetical protein
MANRRRFLTVAGVGLASVPVLGSARDADGAVEGRDVYELRQYQLADEGQKQGLDAFLRDAAIPAMNRVGIEPVGVFYPEEGLSPVRVLMRHRSIDSVLSATQRMLSDTEFLRRGAAFLDAAAEKPAFQRMESSLFLAFKSMPAIETPVKGQGRVFQLRIYESPSVKTGQKKIEMFNDAGEIVIFRRVGLHPVFFGEALSGTKLPNLTYMLAFESQDELKANWKKFGADPDWKRLKGMPEFSDKAILSGITNLLLKPAEYSQV